MRRYLIVTNDELEHIVQDFATVKECAEFLNISYGYAQQISCGIRQTKKAKYKIARYDELLTEEEKKEQRRERDKKYNNKRDRKEYQREYMREYMRKKRNELRMEKSRQG